MCVVDIGWWLNRPFGGGFLRNPRARLAGFRPFGGAFLGVDSFNDSLRIPRARPAGFGPTVGAFFGGWILADATCPPGGILACRGCFLSEKSTPNRLILAVCRVRNLLGEFYFLISF